MSVVLPLDWAEPVERTALLEDERAADAARFVLDIERPRFQRLDHIEGKSAGFH